MANYFLPNFFVFEVFIKIVLFIILLVCMLIVVAFFTVYERKLLAALQQRLGPNKVGFLGLLQAVADGLKVFTKETIIPLGANRALFIFAPMMTFFLSMLAWIVIPMGPGVVVSNLNIGVIFILAISSLNVYSVILSGWASNSRYAFLGALRSTAQMISYELTMGTNILCVILCAGSLNLTDIVISQKSLWFCFPLFPTFLIFLICCLAETNRSPFDLPEAESELVSGYNTEYAGFSFAMFFLGEYLSILLLCNFIVILFLGGWLPVFDFEYLNFVPHFVWYFVKVIFFMSFFI